ncbi:DNA cytosine methyltransferase [Methanococcus maripaludis]|uniref:DNA cytosine methyltransferase n=1 Tax=Methanococcus maripaludis TaxID=39152 RepID=UPI003141B43C
MNFIDLFCGCGGFSRGFVEMGFKPLLAIELDENAANSYALNYNGLVFEKKLNDILEKDVYFKLEDFLVQDDIEEFKKSNNYENLNPVVINEDIREINSKYITNKIKDTSYSKIDLIIGGPPCEGYTGANPKRERSPFNRLYRDPVGRLVLDYIRIVGDISPEVFVMENVPGILNYETRENIEKEFSRAGYDELYFHVFDSENYGNPSFRKRVIISNIPLNLEKTDNVDVKTALSNIDRNALNNEKYPLPEKIAKSIHKINVGDSAVKFKACGGVLDNYIRLSMEGNAETVMGKRRFIHPEEDRLLTVREQARLMSYPDTHIFAGGITAQYNQVGESVPPSLSLAIAKEVKKYFNK